MGSKLMKRIGLLGISLAMLGMAGQGVCVALANCGQTCVPNCWTEIRDWANAACVASRNALFAEQTALLNERGALQTEKTSLQTERTNLQSERADLVNEKAGIRTTWGSDVAAILRGWAQDAAGEAMAQARRARELAQDIQDQLRPIADLLEQAMEREAQARTACLGS